MRLERNPVQIVGRRNTEPRKDRWSEIPHVTGRQRGSRLAVSRLQDGDAAIDVPSGARVRDGTDTPEGWGVYNIRRLIFVEHDQIRIGEIGPVLRSRTCADDFLDEPPSSPAIAEHPDLLAELITEYAVILR